MAKQHGIQSIGANPEQETLLEIAHLGNDPYTPVDILLNRAVCLAKKCLSEHCEIEVG